MAKVLRSIPALVIGFLSIALFARSGQAAFVFTDSTLTAQVTSVKAVHITELRSAISTLRSRNGLASFSFTDSTLTAGVTQIKAAHITDLRTALSGVYSALGLAQPVYTDAALTAGQTAIKAAHITEIRSAVNAADLFLLTVTKAGTGSGTVTSAPAGVSGSQLWHRLR